MTDRPTVLIVEDDESTAAATAYHLAKAGYAASVSRDGLAAIAALKSWQPDALVLDLMLPHRDGWGVIREVRRWAPHLPVIIMTARADADRGEAMRLGADDLLRKPFPARDLLARLEVILRRADMRVPADAVGAPVGDLEIDRTGREVRVAGSPVALTPLETTLLWILMDGRGRTVTRDEIFDQVWGGARRRGDRSVDVLVRRLRRKVDEAGGAYTYVQTDHGWGYRLEAVPKAFPLPGRRRPQGPTTWTASTATSSRRLPSS